jgi:hypothetical protein
MSHPVVALSLSVWIFSSLAGCAGLPTRIESTWVDPTFDRPAFGRVAVLALFDTVAESRNFETQATSLLEERGVEAVAGHQILAPDVRYTQQEMERELMGADVDGLLIYRLIAVDERRVYRRPTEYLSALPPGVVWGDPFYWYYYPQWNYYWHWRSSFAVTRSPGYWQEYTYVTVESSLYDNETDQLVWTAKSETMDGSRFERLAGSVADEITDRLIDLGLLRTDQG